MAGQKQAKLTEGEQFCSIHCVNKDITSDVITVQQHLPVLVFLGLLFQQIAAKIQLE